MPSPTRILILDDHRLFADGLSLIIRKLATDPLITTETNIEQVLAKESTLSSYDLILVDLKMPKISGFDFLKLLEKRKINTPTIIVSSTENRSDIEKSLQLGAKGFIPKNAPAHDMISGMQAVLSGKTYVPEHLIGNINWQDTNSPDDTDSSTVISIKPRQVEILELMHLGHSNIQISTILNLSESTIKGYISSLFKLFNVKNRTACVRAAVEHKIIKN